MAVKKSRTRVRSKTINDGKGCQTIQSEKHNCDVNVIMAKYAKTGLAPINKAQPRYGDMAQVKDYQEAMNVVAESQQMFDLLPEEIKTNFNNSPEKFLEFCNNPENQEKMKEMGLIEKDPIENPETGIDLEARIKALEEATNVTASETAEPGTSEPTSEPAQ